MELLLTRSQRTGLRAMVFVLNLRARLTDEEQANVQKYRLGKDILYQKESMKTDMVEGGWIRQLFTLLTAKARGHVFTANDLVKGRSIECKDIVEMIDTENQIRLAADTFYKILLICQSFDGEEVLSYPRDL